MIHRSNYFIDVYGGVGVDIDYLNDANCVKINGIVPEIELLDKKLRPSAAGKYVIDIRRHHLKYFPGVELPVEIEIPAKLIEERLRQKRLNIFCKDYFAFDPTCSPWRYFYIDDGRLQVVQGEKVAYASKIELIYGRKAVRVDSLELGHPYLELPAEVTQHFEKVLTQEAEDEAILVPVGTSLLNGKQYYRLNTNISPEHFAGVKEFFEKFDGDDAFQGWLTCFPNEVSECLNIQVK